jgi:hypothetical protein
MSKKVNEQQAKESLSELNIKTQENERLKGAIQREKIFYKNEKERLEKRY